jgi:hypothetical protein
MWVNFDRGEAAHSRTKLPIPAIVFALYTRTKCRALYNAAVAGEFNLPDEMVGIIYRAIYQEHALHPHFSFNNAFFRMLVFETYKYAQTTFSNAIELLCAI